MDTQEHLYDLVKDFATAVLVTHAGEGEIHARPMAIAELKRDADACFATSMTSAKISEIQADPRVLVTFQGSSAFAAIAGEASTSRDRAEIDRLWSDTWKAWFPKGKDDPDLVLLKVAAKSGEYWDNSGAKGIKYIFDSVLAVARGTRPETDEGQHAKVTLK